MELVNGVRQFRINFCGRTGDACEQTLADPTKLDQVIGAYLEQFAKADSLIETFYNVLANSIKMKSEDTGWGGTEIRRYWQMDIPLRYQGKIADSMVISGSPVHLILNAGTFRFEINRGDIPAISVEASWVDARSTPLVSYSQTNKDAGASHRDPWSPALIDAPLGCYCDDWTSVSEDAERRLRGRDEVRVGPLAPFSLAQMLSVVTTTDTASCDQQCDEVVGASVVEAVALWRSGCKDCDPWMFSIIRASNGLYVDTELIDALTVAGGSDRTVLAVITPNSISTGPRLSDPSALSRFYFGSSGRAITGYRNIKDDVALRNAFCAVDLPAQMHEAICSKGQCPECLKIQVRMLAGETHCGSDRAIIACASPNAGIELSFGQFAFTGELPGPDGLRGVHGISYKLGVSRRTVGLRYVLLHEIGHYFGLPHVHDSVSPSGRSNILSENYESDRFCITPSNFSMLDRSARTTWASRIKECSGLRYLKSSKSIGISGTQ